MRPFPVFLKLREHDRKVRKRPGNLNQVALSTLLVGFTSVRIIGIPASTQNYRVARHPRRNSAAQRRTRASICERGGRGTPPNIAARRGAEATIPSSIPAASSMSSRSINPRFRCTRSQSASAAVMR
jgi:hypothetical protein